MRETASEARGQERLCCGVSLPADVDAQQYTE